MLELIYLNALVLLIHMCLWFLDAVIHKNFGLVDIAWGLNFVIVAWTSFFITETVSWMAYILLGLVSIWGLRLTYHLWFRNRGKSEDFRYVNMRKNFGKYPNIHAFFKVFMFQGLLALIISLPLQAAMLVSVPNTLFEFIMLGLGIVSYMIGFIFEALGDLQLKRFKKDPKHKGAIMTKGLWSLTRHPNYFGDFMIWLSFTIIALSSLEFQYSYIIIGFLIMAGLLRFVSGVPLLEKKYKGNIAYQSYAKHTPIFFPKIFKR